MLELQNTNWNNLFQQVIHSPYLWLAIAAIVIGVIIWLGIRTRHRVINLSSHQEGRVAVVQTALVDLIENTCNEIVPNSKPRVCLCEKDGKLNLRIKIRVFSDQNIERTTSALQKQINHVLHNALGIDNIGTINILIAGFRKAPTKSIADEAPDVSGVETEK